MVRDLELSGIPVLNKQRVVIDDKRTPFKESPIETPMLLHYFQITSLLAS
jgi:hypothetical protein